MFSLHCPITFPEYFTQQYLVENVNDNGYLVLKDETTGDIRSDLWVPDNATVETGTVILVAKATWGDNIREEIINCH